MKVSKSTTQFINLSAWENVLGTSYLKIILMILIICIVLLKYIVLGDFLNANNLGGWGGVEVSLKL